MLFARLLVLGGLPIDPRRTFATQSWSSGYSVDERLMRNRWQRDLNEVVRRHDPAFQHDGHHTAFAHQPIRRLNGHFFKQPRLEIFDLLAWIAQAGDFDDGLRTELKAGTLRQAEQVHAARDNVFA